MCALMNKQFSFLVLSILSLYLYCPVMAQFWLFLQFLLQVVVGLCLLGPDRSGPEATVVTCRVTFKQHRALLGVYGHQDHTWEKSRRRGRMKQDGTKDYN